MSLWRSAVPSLQRHVMACFPLCLEGLYLFFIETFRGYKIDDLFEQSETLQSYDFTIKAIPPPCDDI